MNEQELARNIARRLTQGLDSVPPTVASRLKAGREAALLRAGTAGPEASPRIEDAPPRLGWLGPRLFAPALGLVVALLAMLYWQQTREEQAPVMIAEPQAPAVAPSAEVESADVDAAVLAEELPVTAYLDQGFEVWLYHATPADEQP